MHTISFAQRIPATLAALWGGLVLGVVPVHAAPLFPAISVEVGVSDARALAIGDFSGDGKPDLVTANSGSNTISVLLGNGDGWFGTATQWPTGLGPVDVTLADVNNDGHLDAVTANRVANTASIVIGNGVGGVVSIWHVQTGSQPSSARVADVNGDGLQDILVANYAAYTFSVLLRKPDGTYFPKVDYPCTPNPTSLALGDVNNDGKLDAAVSGEFTPHCGVVLGNGDGTFQYPISAHTGGSQFGVALVDLNADGKLDLITANGSEAQRSAVVELGNGDGTFGPRVEYSTIGGSRSIEVVDVTGDGKLDIVANPIVLLPGKGDGTFDPANVFATDAGGYATRVADLNGDGHLDVATVSGQIYVLLGFGNGPVGRRQFSHNGDSENGLEMMLTSLNDDMSPDVVVFEQGCSRTACGPRYVTRFLGSGDASFGALARFELFNPNYPLPPPRGNGLTVGDFNGDSRIDAVASNSGADLITMLGNGDGTFGTQVRTVVNSSTYPIRSGDFDHDGKLDLVVGGDLSNPSRVWHGVGDGTFSAGATLPTGGWITVAWVDTDEHLDLLRTDPGTSQVVLARGNGDGTFAPSSNFLVGASPQRVAVGDVNEDGKRDLVVTNHAAANISVLLGMGDGTFEPAVEFPTTQVPLSITLADLDGDGHLDVAVGGRMVSVLRGLGDGTFGTHEEYSPFAQYDYANMVIVARDLDGDHRPELVIGQTNSFTVLRNIGTGPIVSVESSVVSALALAIAPNPARASADLSFTLSSEDVARVEVLDVSGRRVASVFEGRLTPGIHSMKWQGTNVNGRRVKQGIYLVRLTVGGKAVTRRLAWLGI